MHRSVYYMVHSSSYATKTNGKVRKMEEQSGFVCLFVFEDDYIIGPSISFENWELSYYDCSALHPSGSQKHSSHSLECKYSHGIMICVLTSDPFYSFA